MPRPTAVAVARDGGRHHPSTPEAALPHLPRALRACVKNAHPRWDELVRQNFRGMLVPHLEPMGDFDPNASKTGSSHPIPTSPPNQTLP